MTTAVGGNLELVQNGRDGFVVPFGDETALIDAILAALSKEWDHEAISGRARSRTWDHAAAQVLAELEAVLSERRAAPGPGLPNPARRRP